jgi:hypothetical protein
MRMRPWDMDGLYGVGAKHSRSAGKSLRQSEAHLIFQGAPSLG